MMSHIDCWATLAKMVGLTPPPHRGWVDNSGKPIYFDSIDNSDYILGNAKHSARRTWIYLDGENFTGSVRADIAGDPSNPDVSIAWKYLWTAKDTWLGPSRTSAGSAPSTIPHHGPFSRNMTWFSSRMPMQSPGKYAGQDNGWVFAVIVPTVMEFNKSIVDYPSIARVRWRRLESTWRPDFQSPDNPVPLLDMKHPPNVKAGGG